MTDNDAAPIMQALGRLEGEMVGLRSDIKTNGDHARHVHEKVTKLAERTSSIELWRAELRGVSIGARLSWGAMIGFVSAVVAVSGTFLFKKLGG